MTIQEMIDILQTMPKHMRVGFLSEDADGITIIDNIVQVTKSKEIFNEFIVLEGDNYIHID